VQATTPSQIRVPTFAAALLLLTPSTHADGLPAHRLGHHPAVVVQRLAKSAGYDYASKFYPHPAGLRLYMAEPPRDTIDAAAPTLEPGEAAGRRGNITASTGQGVVPQPRGTAHAR
jgi:hypothetical protein